MMRKLDYATANEMSYSNADYLRASEYIRTVSELVICMSIDSQMQSCDQLLKNEKIFEWRQINVDQLKSLTRRKPSWDEIIAQFESFSKEHESIKQSISTTGFANYNKWCLAEKEKLNKFRDKLLTFSAIDLHDSHIDLTSASKKPFIIFLTLR